MKVYLAGRYRERDKLKAYSRQLREIGIKCTSRWLDETLQPDTQLHEVSDEELLMYAQWDLEDVRDADTLVQICDVPNTRGGAHVEFGYALAKFKRIVVVGPEHNIFHKLPQVHKFETWETALTYLKDKSAEADHLLQST